MDAHMDGNTIKRSSKIIRTELSMVVLFGGQEATLILEKGWGGG